MKKILVAVDGSAQSMRAVSVGGKIAACFGAELLLLHVVRDAVLPNDIDTFAEIEHLSGGTGAVLHKAAKYVLSNAEDLAHSLDVINVDAEILVGPPARTIAQYSADHAVDLIVIGRRGNGAGDSLLMDGISDFLTGGVSRRVGNLAKCDCLTVI